MAERNAKRLPSFWRSHKLVLVIAAVASVFAVAGLVLLTSGYAEMIIRSSEAESGVVDQKQVVSDPTASGGKAVRFSTDTGSSDGPVYGVTLDNLNGIGQSALNQQVDALSRLPHKPTVRVVFDQVATSAGYLPAITALRPHVGIMGELMDSSYLKQSSAQQAHDRTAQLLAGLKDVVDVWEVGNEVNGGWTGPYSDVSAKISDSYAQVKAAGGKAALTLWYNPNCASVGELDPLAFSSQYVPTDMRSGLDYVYISYYETQCNNYRPDVATLTKLFQGLHALYPSARLGFGEVGLPEHVSAANLTIAQSIASYYYGLKIDLPYYAGGYFWWYFAEDAVPYDSKPMWQTINIGMKKY